MTLNTFYEQIMARCLTVAPEIKHFDLYFRQDEPQNEEEELPFQRPAVLFEFMPMDYQSFGNKRKAADALFRLHILSDVVQEVDSKTAPNIRVKGHAHLALIDKIDKGLQGFNGSGFNSIASVGIEPYQPNGMVIKHIGHFKTRLNNDAARRNFITPNPLPSQSITITNHVPGNP